MEPHDNARNISKFITDVVIHDVFEIYCKNNFCKITEYDIREKVEPGIRGLLKTLHIIGKEESEVDVLHLPMGRITLMKKALDLLTFEAKDDDGNVSIYIQKLLRDYTGERIKVADLRKSSIVIDAIIFVHQIAGVQIPIDEHNYVTVIVLLKDFLSNKPKLLEQIGQMKKNRCNHNELIKCTINLVLIAYADGVFWMIASKLYANMTYEQKTLNTAHIIAFIAILIFTTPNEIAALCTYFVKFEDFVTKLENLDTLTIV